MILEAGELARLQAARFDAAQELCRAADSLVQAQRFPHMLGGPTGAQAERFRKAESRYDALTGVVANAERVIQRKRFV